MKKKKKKKIKRDGIIIRIRIDKDMMDAIVKSAKKYDKDLPDKYVRQSDLWSILGSCEWMGYKVEEGITKELNKRGIEFDKDR